MEIRPATPDDYPVLVLLGNVNFPDHKATEAEMRWNDDHREPTHKWGRFVGAMDGEVVCVGEYGQEGGMYHPRKFGLMIMVHPDKQGQGLGKALYAHLLDAIAPFSPLSVRSFAREDMARPVRFLHDRGFVEDMRFWESVLDVPAFDFSPFDGAEEKPAQHGITTTTLDKLQKSDAHWKRNLYEMSQAIQRDIPRPEPWTPTDFKVWEQRFDNPNVLPDANFIALDGDKYVGISTLYKSEADDHLHTGITGVLPDYRRKGIALALKLQAIRYAKNAGAPFVRTGNETRNRPMLAINEVLGFVKKPAWITFVRVLQTEVPGE